MFFELKPPSPWLEPPHWTSCCTVKKCKKCNRKYPNVPGIYIPRGTPAHYFCLPAQSGTQKVTVTWKKSTMKPCKETGNPQRSTSPLRNHTLPYHNTLSDNWNSLQIKEPLASFSPDHHGVHWRKIYSCLIALCCSWKSMQNKAMINNVFCSPVYSHNPSCHLQNSRTGFHRA